MPTRQLAVLARSAGVDGDAVTERTGVTVLDKSLHDRTFPTEQEVRERLGRDRWTRACTAGRATTIDSLLEDIDRILGKATDA